MKSWKLIVVQLCGEWSKNKANVVVVALEVGDEQEHDAFLDGGGGLQVRAEHRVYQIIDVVYVLLTPF